VPRLGQLLLSVTFAVVLFVSSATTAWSCDKEIRAFMLAAVKSERDFTQLPEEIGREGVRVYTLCIDSLGTGEEDTVKKIQFLDARSNMLGQIGDLDSSLADIEAAEALVRATFPDRSELLIAPYLKVGRAELKLKQRDSAGALEGVETVLAKLPDYVPALAIRAIVGMSNDSGRALDDINRAIELAKPAQDNLEALHIIRAEIYDLLRQDEQAAADRVSAAQYAHSRREAAEKQYAGETQ
jgi:hypothetical protein